MISAWFLSDLHLKNLEERRSQILLRFLVSLNEGHRSATHLYLLGDIFDLWVGDHNYFYKKFQPIVDQILSLHAKGVKITYVEGNHDVHVQKFWQKHGIPCYINEHYDQVGPYLIRIEHGDLVNQQDTVYLKYRKFLRGLLIQALAEHLPGVVIQKIGERASRESRKRSSIKRKNSEHELREMIRRYAEQAYQAGGFDYIFTGHMHIRDEYDFVSADHKKIKSVNLGSWFDQELVYHLHDQGGEWVDVQSDL